jgi:hypothetical protein
VLKLWLGWPTTGGGGQYLVEGGGGQYPTRGGGGGHVGCCPTVGDSLHGIMGVGPI